MLNGHLVGEVGIILTEQWIDKILLVVNWSSDHDIKITCWKNNLINIMCLCPQCGKPCEEKYDFYLVLFSSISTVSPDVILIVWEDLNVHLGKDSGGFKGIHDGYGYGIRNTDGTRVSICVSLQTL